MQITVVGAGHAGLVSAAGLARFGHQVTCVDIDVGRVATLEAGGAPFFEPGLDALLAEGVAAKHLRFVHSSRAADAYTEAEMLFVVVDTPRRRDGAVELAQVEAVVAEAATHLRDGVVVVLKSTVPVGTTREMGERLGALRPGLRFAMASNPEFLRQGTAVVDFLAPDRIVIGVDDAATGEAVKRAHQPLVDDGIAVLVTAIESAELIKYGSNAFLATKLSFINEIADLCEASGAVVEEVAAGLGLDLRIGPAFLKPGPGFGGACLPKDTHALLHTSKAFGTGSRIVAAALSVNEERVHRMVDKVFGVTPGSRRGRRVAMLGITFKADTDDIRESPAVEIAAALVAAGAKVTVFDPRGMTAARGVLPAEVEFAADAYSAVTGAQVAVIATEWREFRDVDLVRVRDLMATPVLIDLRNLLPAGAAAAAGLRYVPIGRRAD
jgi:UDPglucose 6-dehydrogenase